MKNQVYKNQMMASLRLFITCVVAVCALSLNSAFAVVNYQLTHQVAAYAPISVAGGAAVIAAPASGAVNTFTGTTTTGNVNDGTAYISLPFNFAFGGGATPTNYVAGTNFLGISTNGFAYFSTVNTLSTKFTSNANSSNIPSFGNLSPTGSEKMMAPWYDDLSLTAPSGWDQLPNSGQVGNVLYQTIGTSPNRVFVIQWTDVPSYNVTSTVVGVGQPKKLNFQIKLYETTNVIEYAYGPTSGSNFYYLESATIALKTGPGVSSTNPNSVDNYLDGVTGSRFASSAFLSTNKFPSGKVIRYTPYSIAPAPITGGTYTVGVGNNLNYVIGGGFNSLSDAIREINQYGIGASVTLNLVDAVYDSTTNIFPLILAENNTDVTKTLTIQSSLATPPSIQYSGATSGSMAARGSTAQFGTTTEAILTVMGSDYVKLKNIAFKALKYTNVISTSVGMLGNTSQVDRGLLVAQVASTTAPIVLNGVNFLTVDGVTIEMDRNNTNSIGLASQIYTTSASVVGGAQAVHVNSNNKYLNLKITNCGSAGIQLAGTTAAGFMDQENEIGGTCGSYNIIGDPNKFDDIGGGVNGVTTSTLAGIITQYQFNLKIHDNKITGIGANSLLPSNVFNQMIYGIYNLHAVTTSTYNMGVNSIYNNIIYNIGYANAAYNYSFSGATPVTVIGISANSNQTNTAEMRVYNNLIYGLYNNAVSTASTIPLTGSTTVNNMRIIGISAQTLGAHSAPLISKHFYDHNTVYIDNKNLLVSSTCFGLFAGAGSVPTLANAPIMNIRSNIFVNATADQSALAKHYAFTTPGSNTATTNILGGAGSYSNRNNLFVPNFLNGFVAGAFGSAAGQDYPYLENPGGPGNYWQGIVYPAFPRFMEDSSNSQDPYFFSLLDMNNPDFHVINGALDQTGGTLDNWNTTDLDCNVRADYTASDMGAYAFIPPAIDIAARRFMSPTTISCHGSAEPVVVRIRNFAAATIDFAVNPVTFNVTVGGAGSGSFSYVLNTGTLAGGLTQDITVGTTNTSVPGNYTFSFSISVPGDANASNDSHASGIVTIQPFAVQISGANTTCDNQEITLTANTQNSTGAVTYLWSPGGKTTQAVIVNPSSTTAYQVTANDACGFPVTSAPFTVTVKPSPTVSVTPDYFLFCDTLLSQTVTLEATADADASGGLDSLKWSPDDSLRVPAGGYGPFSVLPMGSVSSVMVNRPTQSAVYTVRAYAGNGCYADAAAQIVRKAKYVITASSNRYLLCPGDTATLTGTGVGANGNNKQRYEVTKIAYNPQPVPTNAGPAGASSLTSPKLIGFVFNYFGVTYNKFGISTEGNIQLGNGSGTIPNSTYSTSIISSTTPSTSTPNAWIGMMTDLNTLTPTGKANNITYGTYGNAPNRRLVVSYNDVGHGSNTPAGAESNFQIILYETSNIIEIHLKEDSNTTNTKLIGMESPRGDTLYFAPGFPRSDLYTPVTTKLNSPVAWRFTPQSPSRTYTSEWTPTDFLKDPSGVITLAEAITTTTLYSLIANDPFGCQAIDTAFLNVDPLGAFITLSTVSDNDSICQGKSTKLKANPSGIGPFTFEWFPGGQTTQIVTVSPTATTAYSVKVTGGTCGSGGSQTAFSAPFTVTVDSTPVVTVTPDYNTICYEDVNRTRTLTAGGTVGPVGGNTIEYLWKPNTTLNDSTSASVIATPLSTTNYTVTATLGKCSSTANALVRLPGIVSVQATATPEKMCPGFSTNLNVKARTTVTYSGAAIFPPDKIATPETGVTTITAADVPRAGAQNVVNHNTSYAVKMPFPFSFFDAVYDTVFINVNGFVQFGTKADTSTTFTAIPNNTATQPNNAIYLSAYDKVFGNAGAKIQYFTVGVAPARTFVIKYDSLANTALTGYLKGQIELQENGIIALVVDSAYPTGTKVMGIENATGTVASAIANRNNTSHQIISREKYVYSPTGGTLATFLWDPAVSVLNPTAASTPTVPLFALPYSFNVVATDTSGCKGESAVTVVEGSNMAGSIENIDTSTDLNYCVGETVILNTVITEGSVASTEWYDDAGTLLGSTPSVAFAALDPNITPSNDADNIYTYTAVVYGECTLDPLVLQIDLTFNGQPTVTATTSASLICGQPATLTATGGISYKWTPNIGLVDSLSASVLAFPSTNVLYTATVTDANGCKNMATVDITKSNSLGGKALAVDSILCVGGGTQLIATVAPTDAYNVSSIPFAPDATVLPNICPALGDEGNQLVSLPFSFPFYGNNFTQVTIHSNGQIFMGNQALSGPFFPPTLPNTATPNNWVGFWTDQNIPTPTATKYISYGIVGTAPNRKFIAHWEKEDYYFSTPYITYQIELSENGTIDVFIYDLNGNTASKAIGMENAFGTAAVVPPNRNTGNWTLTSADPEGWRFSIATIPLNYSWTPTTGLSNPNIENPMLSGVAATTIYTVTATTVEGCNIVQTAKVYVNPLQVDSLGSKKGTSYAGVICEGSTLTLTAYTKDTTGSKPLTFVWKEDGNPLTVTTVDAGSGKYSVDYVPTVAGAHTYSVDITDACGLLITKTKAVTVNAKPTIAVTKTGGSQICAPLTVPDTLKATGNSNSYSWTPGTGLSSTSVASPTINIGASNIYTVTGTLTATGCTNSAILTVNVASKPGLSVSATPNNVCPGGSSQLNANAKVAANYSVISIPFTPVDTGLLTNRAGVLGDEGNTNVADIGFSFPFYDQFHSSVTIHSNGQILMGSGRTDANSQYTPPTIPATTAPNNWVGFWADLNVSSTPTKYISYGTVGVAPNRKFVAHWENIDYWSATPYITYQIVLNENDGSIDIFLYHTQTSNTNALGMENSTGLLGSFAPGRNAGTWATNNEAWKFVPPVPAPLQYTWTPNTFLDDASIATPLASNVTASTTYSVGVLDPASGCTATGGVLLTAGALNGNISSPINTVCPGAPVTMKMNIIGGSAPYVITWSDGSHDTILTVSPPTTTVYSATVTDACGGSITPTFTVFTNTVPTIAVTPPSSLICNSNIGVPLLASGSFNSLVWSPSNSLEIDTGVAVIANPSLTTIYSAIGTLTASGCTAVGTATVNKVNMVVSALSSPYNLCNGSVGQLKGNAFNGLSNYLVSAIPVNPDPTPLANITPALNDEGNQLVNLPFNFNFYGSDFSQVTIHSNGQIVMGNTPISGPFTPPTLPNTASPNNWVGFWADLNIPAPTATKYISYGVVGTAPNRKFIAHWEKEDFYFSTPSVTYQIELNETSNIIDVFILDLEGRTNTKAIGMENAAGTVAAFPPTRNSGTWTITSATKEAWRFTPPSGGVSYSWSPSTFLSSTVVPDPFVSGLTTNTVYTLTGTETSTGCSASDTTIVRYRNRPTAVISGNAEICVGASTVLHFAFTGIGPWSYRFTDGTNIYGPFNSSTPTATRTVSPAGSGNASVVYTMYTINDTYCSGNNSGDMTGSATITFDQVKPVISGCPANLGSQCNPVSWTAPTVTDNCSVNMISNYAPGDSLPHGDNVINYVATDSNGNTASCSFTVHVPTPSIATDVVITSSRPYNNICKGELITLTLSGGTLGEGAVWKWYSGSCGGTLVASGVTSITVAPTVSTTYYVRAQGICNTTICQSLDVNVSQNSPTTQLNVTLAPVTGYVGGSDLITVNPIPGATFYRWTSTGDILFNGQPSPFETTVPSVNITYVQLPSNGISGWTVHVFGGNACGRTNTANARIRSSTETPTSIAGDTVACGNQTKTYTVAPVTGAKAYSWSLSNNTATILSGQGTNTVTVKFNAGFSAVDLCVAGVTAFNLVGPDYCITIDNQIGAAGPVTGDPNPCPGSTSTYSTTAVQGAVGYIWTYPGGGPDTTAGTSKSITFPVVAFTGNVTVKPYSGCGTGTQASLALVSGVAAPVGTISGDTTGLCGAVGKNYQVPSSGATFYDWTVPAGATITSGDGTNSILVDFTNAFAGGPITIVTSNACGTTNGSLTVTGAPAPPVITGSPSACADDVEPYAANSPGATVYHWSVNASEAVILGYGVSGDSSDVTISWITSGGSISVTADNACGTSVASVFVVSNSCRTAGSSNLADALNARVFPNPTQGRLTLQYNSAVKSDYSMKITDLTGRAVRNEVLSGIEGLNQYEFDLSNVAKGMYMLSLENTSGETIVIRVVVE